VSILDSAVQAEEPMAVTSVYPLHWGFHHQAKELIMQELWFLLPLFTLVAGSYIVVRTHDFKDDY
jgi:hypothetical protein